MGTLDIECLQYNLNNCCQKLAGSIGTPLTPGVTFQWGIFSYMVWICGGWKSCLPSPLTATPPIWLN